MQAAPKSLTAVARPAESPKPQAVSAKAVKSAKSSDADAPLIPKGAIMLQVAAVMRQDDALGLAQALQQKKFPAFVIPPGADKYYRVQVGPYADSKSMETARDALAVQGYYEEMTAARVRPGLWLAQLEGRPTPPRVSHYPEMTRPADAWLERELIPGWSGPALADGRPLTINRFGMRDRPDRTTEKSPGTVRWSGRRRSGR